MALDEQENAGGLSDDAYQRFFTEKAVINTCPACGAGDFKWGVNMARRSIPALLGVPEQPRSYDPVSRLPLAYLECSECGHILLFNRLAIQRWLRANPPVADRVGRQPRDV